MSQEAADEWFRRLRKQWQYALFKNIYDLSLTVVEFVAVAGIVEISEGLLLLLFVWIFGLSLLLLCISFYIFRNVRHLQKEQSPNKASWAGKTYGKVFNDEEGYTANYDPRVID